MNRVARGAITVVLLGILFAGGIGLIHSGVYGLSVFLILPVLLGGVGSWFYRPSTGSGAAAVGAVTAILASSSLLLLGLEGAICIVMALPLSIPLAMLGSWLVYKGEDSGRLQRGAALLLLLPPGLIFDTHAAPPVYAVRTAVEINAAPETVWRNVVTFSELPEPAQWYFRAGLAYPERARIEGTGPGAVRYCEFSTEPFVEPIETWDEPRLLAFRVTQNPAPMHEWSPYAHVLPRHLHGYLVSKHGQFRLTPLPGNRTLLEGTTWYQHGLWPAPYWRLWSDAIIHRIHLRVLEHIRTLSEKS